MPWICLSQILLRPPGIFFLNKFSVQGLIEKSDKFIVPLAVGDRLISWGVFCTNLGGKAHKIISAYDKRADVENLVGEAKREGLDAIPSAKFKTNYAYFQIVMLAYNIWRYLKMIAQLDIGDDHCDQADDGAKGLPGIMNNTIRIARLKLLFIAAKVVKEYNVDKVKYSMGAALLRRPLLTICDSLYCFIVDEFFYLITFRLSRFEVESEAIVSGTRPPA